MTFWSPKAYTLNAWQWPTNQIKPLASALVTKKVEAKAKDDIGLKLLSIRFDGTMDERNALPESLKGKLYLAVWPPGRSCRELAGLEMLMGLELQTRVFTPTHA